MLLQSLKNYILHNERRRAGRGFFLAFDFRCLPAYHPGIIVTSFRRFPHLRFTSTQKGPEIGSYHTKLQSPSCRSADPRLLGDRQQRTRLFGDRPQGSRRRATGRRFRAKPGSCEA
ncbi:hypothetical protein MAPG_06497 [Magnaporthiopsis poae ATCC 64411]|uniref:Uncharacterized protein n=1 Tax=Magnaporthiopsis poae (strain ATCC 64411 / 73-15) TaxID=644358 RepID=A0A0C4E268_MAGP6|nr:hypothetical protein MAPG_06497 [Magnaporthiopsis poae ATCC 64411]